MKIILNGKETVLKEEVSLVDFLNSRDLDLDKIVVEYNKNVVKSEEWSNITLKENDQLEVLRFVGGG